MFVAVLALTAACSSTIGSTDSADGTTQTSSTSGADAGITAAATSASPTNSPPSAVPTTLAAAPTPPVATTRAYVPPPPPRTTRAAEPTHTTARAQSCYPLTNGGKCYSPGEYCRDSDHGASGIDADGDPIKCEDNDGWRWERV